MAWDIEVAEGCAVVHMYTSEAKVQNYRFFADLHGAFDRLEREFSDLPVVLTGQCDRVGALATLRGKLYELDEAKRSRAGQPVAAASWAAAVPHRLSRYER